MLLFRQTSSFLALALLASAFFVACDSGDEDPVIEETIVVGTNVPEDFTETGMFGLDAIGRR